jgi:hypothetical protein
MTHFLARLVERARGTARRVEPIIASRFVPPPPSEIAIENESRETRSEPRPAPAAAKSVRETQSEPRSAPAEAKSVPKPDAAIRSESVSTSAETTDVPIEIVRETLLVPQFQEQAPPLVVRQTDSQRNAQPTQTNAIALEKNEATKPKTLRASRATLQREQARAFLSKTVLASLPDEPRDQAPIVRVTIGRIDVRAAPAPVPPPRKPLPSPGPALTLDAYLKQRKEATR